MSLSALRWFYFAPLREILLQYKYLKNKQKHMPFEITETGELIADENNSSDKLMLRSEEVSEIISSRPSFLVRYR